MFLVEKTEQMFMKLLKKTSDINIVKTCQHMFGFEIPSVLLARRTRKFLEKNEKFMSWGESFQNRLQINGHVFHYTDNCHVYFVFAYCVFFDYYVVCVFITTISLVK